MEPSWQACMINKHILVAVDESDNAKRAVTYVALMLGGLKGFTVTLINIVPVPPDDFFANAEERSSWIQDNEAKSKLILEGYQEMLIESGVDGESVKICMKTGEYPSVAQVILNEATLIGAGTIALGRRGISKQEEFIYGSTSNKILHSQKSCSALWVIE
jgi:nucleotide-binding universal stress UspA family protein